MANRPTKGRTTSVVVGALIVVGLLVYQLQSCLVTTNEIGILGADKAGRQIFLQSFTSPNVDVGSEFSDRPLFLRFFAEPLRTTIRFTYPSTVQAPDPAAARAFLDNDMAPFVLSYRSKIHLREDWAVEPTVLLETARKQGLKTMEDLLGGFGFTRLEAYQNGQEVYRIALRQKRQNAKLAGSF